MPDIPRFFPHEHTEDRGDNSCKLLQKHSPGFFPCDSRCYAYTSECLVKQRPESRGTRVHLRLESSGEFQVSARQAGSAC